jgi:hypothetical protein
VWGLPTQLVCVCAACNTVPSWRLWVSLGVSEQRACVVFVGVYRGAEQGAVGKRDVQVLCSDPAILLASLHAADPEIDIVEVMRRSVLLTDESFRS